MARPILTREMLPAIVDPPAVVEAMREGEVECKALLQSAGHVSDLGTAMVAVRRTELALKNLPVDVTLSLQDTLDQLNTVLRSGKKIPLETVRKGVELIARSIPRVRRAQALKAEVLKNLELGGVDMEKRAQVLEERKQLALLREPKPKPTLPKRKKRAALAPPPPEPPRGLPDRLGALPVARLLKD